MGNGGILISFKRDTLISKIKPSKGKFDEKSLIDLFYKGQSIPDVHHKTLIELLRKQITDKSKIDNNSKLDKLFNVINKELEEIIRLLPNRDTALELISQLELHLRPAYEKRVLNNLDSTLASITNHFKNYKVGLDKSPPARVTFLISLLSFLFEFKYTY